MIIVQALILIVVLIAVGLGFGGVAALINLIIKRLRRGPDEGPPPRGEIFVLRSPDGPEWKVAFGGRVCSPSWRERGPAQAYLDALRAGTRPPEYTAVPVLAVPVVRREAS